MISGVGFGQVVQFQSEPLLKDTCIASIYFISPDISSPSVTPSFNLLPHLYSSFTSFLFTWNPTEMIRISLPSSFSFPFSLFLSFHPLLVPICTSLLPPIQPTLYVLIPFQTDQFVRLCHTHTQIAEWRTCCRFVFLFRSHSYKQHVLTPTYKDTCETHKETQLIYDCCLWTVELITVYLTGHQWKESHTETDVCLPREVNETWTADVQML